MHVSLCWEILFRQDGGMGSRSLGIPGMLQTSPGARLQDLVPSSLAIDASGSAAGSLAAFLFFFFGGKAFCQNR